MGLATIFQMLYNLFKDVIKFNFNSYKRVFLCSTLSFIIVNITNTNLFFNKKKGEIK